MLNEIVFARVEEVAAVASALAGILAAAGAGGCWRSWSPSWHSGARERHAFRRR
ncbi:MAG TPA: hypothetical protein VFC93_07965 [Chloroflexota bacterium]|nr:hypothetical protein [Chloroflexota bacterium]